MTRCRPFRMTVCLLAQCVACLFFPARAAHALDPTKRLTEYLHTSWRTQDGSSPAPMFAIAQMADGFLWFSSHSHNIYRAEIECRQQRDREPSK